MLENHVSYIFDLFKNLKLVIFIYNIFIIDTGKKNLNTD